MFVPTFANFEPIFNQIDVLGKIALDHFFKLVLYLDKPEMAFHLKKKNSKSGVPFLRYS